MTPDSFFVWQGVQQINFKNTGNLMGFQAPCSGVAGEMKRIFPRVDWHEDDTSFLAIPLARQYHSPKRPSAPG